MKIWMWPLRPTETKNAPEGALSVPLFARGQKYGNVLLARVSGKYPTRFKPSRIPSRFFGVASFRKGRARNTQTEWASATRNTHDHTASKGVSDRLGRGITRASSTFPSALAQNRAREYTSRGGVGWTLPTRNRCIHKWARWPTPDRRDIRGKVVPMNCLKGGLQ